MIYLHSVAFTKRYYTNVIAQRELGALDSRLDEQSQKSFVTILEILPFNEPLLAMVLTHL